MLLTRGQIQFIIWIIVTQVHGLPRRSTSAPTAAPTLWIDADIIANGGIPEVVTYDLRSDDSLTVLGSVANILSLTLVPLGAALLIMGPMMQARVSREGSCYDTVISHETRVNLKEHLVLFQPLRYFAWWAGFLSVVSAVGDITR